VYVTVLFASTLGKIFQPFFDAMAWVIAAFYSLVPNYAVAIALLTLAVMAISAPLTIKSTRSMSKMSQLQGPMKELQKKYKNDKVKLNEEMMKLYRENGVNPAAGCVPLIIQFPVFIILYDVIEGLTNTVTKTNAVTKKHTLIAVPRYIGHHTALYQNLVHHPGVMSSFGINLADTLFSHETWGQRIPFVILIAVAIGLQYLQMHQMTKRNGNNNMNAQMQSMQKFMPLIFAVIYIRISAGVNVYFIVSALCRIGLQMWAFRSMPAPAEVRVGSLSGGKPKRRTLMERLAEAQQRALEQQRGAQQAAVGTGIEPAPRPGNARPPRQGGRPNSVKTGGAGNSGTAPAAGSTGKRPRPAGAPSRQRPPARPAEDDRGVGAGRPGKGQRTGGDGQSTGPARPRTKAGGPPTNANRRPDRSNPKGKPAAGEANGAGRPAAAPRQRPRTRPEVDEGADPTRSGAAKGGRRPVRAQGAPATTDAIDRDARKAE